MAGSTAELIKEKLDIVEHLKGSLTLQPAGKNFKALCPFHHEKTPSFIVSPDRQTWHCFGCGLGGDLFTFVMRYENIEFGDALTLLGEKAGVEIRKMSPGEQYYTGLLYDLNSAAKEFFRRELEQSQEAQEYLRSRGLTEETMNEFELGWAPPEPEKLSLHFLNQSYRPEDVIRAGLALKTERGLQIDRFRGRLMFPIHNHMGKVVGFTGRVLPRLDDGKSGKYMNGPETPIFSKSKLLYGFWKSRNPIREAGRAFLVEGQMDFLMTWQSGVKYAVASSGTALTLDHLRTLRKLTDELYVSFDNDEAGLAAGERAIELAEANDFHVKVVSFGGAKDPAEVAAQDPARIAQAIEEARPAPEFYFSRYLPPDTFDRANRDHVRRLRVVLQKLKRLASAVERDFWMKELARKLFLEERVIREESERLKGDVTVREEPPSVREENLKTVDRRELLSQRLLSALFHTNRFNEVEECVGYLLPEYQDVFRTLKEGKKTATDPRVDELLNTVMLRTEDVLDDGIDLLKVELFKEYVKERRQALTREVKYAEASGDEKKLHSALEELRILPIA